MVENVIRTGILCFRWTTIATYYRHLCFILNRQNGLTATLKMKLLIPCDCNRDFVGLCKLAIFCLLAAGLLVFVGDIAAAVSLGQQEQTPNDPNDPVVQTAELAESEQNTEPQESESDESDERNASDSHPLKTPVTTPPRQYEYKKLPNIAYVREADYTLLCDIYQPLGEGPFPAVLAIHGGAWTHGSKLNMIRHAWKLARAGYVVVAINYRLAPRYKFPAQIHDCKRAVRWIRAKQKKLKIDPDQIAVFGYSAGGHLGALLGATDDSDGLDGQIGDEEKKYSARVQCVVVGGGPCEFSWIKSRALVHWIGDTPQQGPELYTRASPLHYASSDDPPFIFFHGGGDRVVPVSSAKKMYERLVELGVESRFRVVGDKSHIATFSDTTWLDEAIEFMDEELDRKHNE